MAHFDLRSPDYFVEKTEMGVRVNHEDYTLDGDKVMDYDLHVFTIDFETKKIQRGPDYWIWDTNVAKFEEWSQALNKSPDEWVYEDTPEYMRIEGTTYKINGADRGWPLPELYYQFALKGHILQEIDQETGATERKVRWIKDDV
jgi:hypothetical protein